MAAKRTSVKDVTKLFFYCRIDLTGVFMKIYFSAFLLFVGLNVNADPSFTNLTSSDFESITKEVSANFAHSPVLGASKMGTILGAACARRLVEEELRCK